MHRLSCGQELLEMHSMRIAVATAEMRAPLGTSESVRRLSGFDRRAKSVYVR